MPKHTSSHLKPMFFSKAVSYKDKIVALATKTNKRYLFTPVR